MQAVILNIADITLKQKKDLDNCSRSITNCDHEINNARLFMDSDNDEVAALAKTRYKFYKNERRRLIQLQDEINQTYNLNVSKILIDISEYARLFPIGK